MHLTDRQTERPCQELTSNIVRCVLKTAFYTHDNGGTLKNSKIIIK